MSIRDRWTRTRVESRRERADDGFPYRRRHRRLVVGLLAAAAACFGLAVWSLLPQPPTGLELVDGELHVPAAMPAEVPTPALVGPTVMPSTVPQPRVEIPALAITAPLGRDLQRNAQGDWVPALYGLGRWGKSAAIGAHAGGVMLAGHVWVGDQPGVLADLHKAQAGQLVAVVDEHGGREEFLISSVHEYARGQLPAGVWGDTDGPRRLVLVTCAGTPVHTAHGRVWSHNLVVEAVPRR